MKLFLKNVTFHGILLDALTDGKNTEWLAVNKLLTQGIAKGVVRPLPSNIFPASKVSIHFIRCSQLKWTTMYTAEVIGQSLFHLRKPIFLRIFYLNVFPYLVAVHCLNIIAHIQ